MRLQNDPQSPCTSYIAGHWKDPGPASLQRENPGRSDEVAAHWCPATQPAAFRAMEAAAAAFPAWATVPFSERIERISPLLEAIRQHEDELAISITRENGKPLRDARAEIGAALRDAAYSLGEARSLGVVEAASATVADVRSELVLEPAGVQLLITPWNFPLATLVRKVVPALLYGNPVVVKPSEFTPGPARLLFQLLACLDLPPGTVSLVYGNGAEIGPVLVGHPALRGVSCTGSTATGRTIALATAGRPVRLQLEMGGKNSLVVLADANLDEAIEAALTGAFSCSGQWCTGTGRVIVERPIHDEFVVRLSTRAAALRVGPGDEEATEIGPVLTAARVAAAQQAVAAAVAAGARVGCGGQARAGGHFFLPTVLDRIEDSHAAFTDELFVPVLPVISARDAQDAVRLANVGSYGLSASVYAEDPARARKLADQIEAGMIHINLHTAYREPGLPVSGWRDSGQGLPECGRFFRDFFTRPRAVYTRQA